MKNNKSDNRHMCGTIVMSACVKYTGNDLTSIDNSELPCNPNINDVISELDKEIKKIQELVDMSDVDKLCLDDCNCTITTIKELFQLLIKKICELQDRVKALEIKDVSQEKFTVNLQSFTNPCFAATNNQYTLLEIINLLITEVSNLKNN